MTNSPARRTGLVILGLLSLGDIASLAVTDGDHPPYAIAALATVLGLISLVLVVRAFRDAARSLRVLIGLRILSAITAMPAFFVSDVPAGAQVAAAAIVALTAVGIVLTASGRTAAVAS